jgi:predicted negative regulator of RcsB-dependent stress response
MNKRYLLVVITLFISLSCFAQNDYSTFWDDLLSNNRDDAEQFIKNNKNTDIEWLVSNEILRNETGKINPNKAFLDSFLSKEDFEFYLFSFWNKSFIFQDYLDEGFNNQIIETLKKVSVSNVKSIDIKDALNYLNAIENRHKNDWDAYYKYNDRINSIKQWQYCGSFENLNKSGLDKVYEAELNPSNDDTFDARSNGFIGWYDASNTKEAYQFFTNHNEYGSGVNYAQTFISSSADQRIVIRVGSGSAFKIFLNDIEIYKNDKDVSTELNAYKVLVNLPKGTNRLLIKSAESNSTSYFLLSLLDKNSNPLEGISISNMPVAYNKSTLQVLNPIEKENEFEAFFKSKIKSNPDNFLYHYALYAAYIRNSKYEEARNVLMPFYKKYAKSSFLRNALIQTYNLEKDYTSSKELRENIERDDPDYYLPILNKLSDYGELSRLSMDEFEDYIKKLKNAFDSELIKAGADFISFARKEDITGIKNSLEVLNELADKYGNTNFKLKYAPLFDQVFQDQDRTIKILEDIVNNGFSISAQNQLINYYEDKNEKKKALALVVRDYENLTNDNIYLKRIANKYIKYQMFNKALPYVDEMLKNYPYSFTTMELKGDVLKQLGKTSEAIKYYEDALDHNSGDSQLRKKINDISKKENILNDLVIEEAYDFIKENRKKILTNNYGFNILLDDSNIEIFEEGGYKYRYVYIYEVTSNNGIETFKEYNLGLGGSYKFLKSELIKPDGSIVPADRSGSNLVFNDISLGDVVYIDYEGIVSTTGRFYKDISDKIQIESFHPAVLTSIDILVPKSQQLYYKYKNGNLEPKIVKKKDHSLYQWEIKNAKALEYAEDYMPNSVDQVAYLHFSTINNWHDIAVWYSDLVRSRIEINTKVKEEFNKLFPNGHKQLSEDQRAKIIYQYITSNFNYSYVSFKQSGFIPQKPAKTINTSLGDCKDFSTLFVTLAKMADLKSNLVLILTSDYGRNNLVLPSTDFNHCIVKVIIDGKPQFLELTNKYLPYKSLPISLRGATALEIPFESEKTTKKYDLSHLDNVQRTKSVISNVVVLNVLEQNMNLDITTAINGHNVSYYNEVFSEPNPDVIKNSLTEDYKAKLVDDFTLNEVSDFNRTEEGTAISFKSDLTINKKLSSIGSIKIMQLPIILHPYENSIIQLEERSYPIEYIQYENVDTYKIEYTIQIEEGQTFVEIPQSKTFKFKDHSYSITYKTLKQNKLEVVINCTTPYENILPEDYKEYKAYVKGILDAEIEYVGFK